MKRILCLLFITTLFTVGCNAGQSDPSLITPIHDTPSFSDGDSEITAPEEASRQTLCHILLLGQSLSMGFESSPCLPTANTDGAYMFRQIRTQDLGYLLGVSKEHYDTNPNKYNHLLYNRLYPLTEAGGYGFAHSQWLNSSDREYETPAAGIVQGLKNAFKINENRDTPWPILISAPGAGGTAIHDFFNPGDIWERAKLDMENGKRLAEEKGLDYCVMAIIWLQGEEDYATPVDTYSDTLVRMMNEYSSLAKNFSGQQTEPVFISYQTMGLQSYYPVVSQNPALAQYSTAQTEENYYLSTPLYSLNTSKDKIHLTAESSRNLGIYLGDTLYSALTGSYSLFSPSSVVVDGNKAILCFSEPVMMKADGLLSSHNMKKALEFNGFFCYSKNGQMLQNSIKISPDGLMVEITCSRDIYRICYGYDAYAHNTRQYTYGGILCRTTPLQGVNGPIYHYMPIQQIYEKDTPTQ